VKNDVVLPPESAMYRALVARDRRYDGAFVAAIATTKIFCRPGCGARKPKRENVRFYATPREALADGFRPCRRCRPLHPSGEAPPEVRAALKLADATLDRRLGAPDLRAAGLEPRRVDRFLKRSVGMTFQAYHRARRMGSALAALKGGAVPSRVPFEVGYASESGFRDAFADVFGAPPKRGRNSVVLVARTLATPLGRMLALADAEGLRLLEFEDRRGLPREIADLRSSLGAAVVPGASTALDSIERELAAYFAGRLREFRTPIVLEGTPFERAAWKALLAIPFGETRTYAGQAAALGKPKAARAVGRANGRNKLAIVVPCHRVLGVGGAPVGYAGGVWRKERLLALERAARDGGRSSIAGAGSRREADELAS
jgi:AraC family transcriptional regulator, regulatory protein of adaptative response / methylated-DNA-[protein]-cysteine methyltransferase